MRLAAVSFTAALALVGTSELLARQLAPAPTIQHVTVSASSSAASAPPGGVVTLWADVTPKPGIHVYAAGAVDFAPVSLLVTPNAAITTGKASYSKPDVATAQGSTGNVPAYAKPFRITQPVTLRSGLARGETVTVAAAVKYQACDDRLCYPATATSVSWTILVK
jgi:DsbC/DsbD-like thiol-disulfide interchange protein